MTAVLAHWKDPEVRKLIFLSVGAGILSSVALSAAYRKISNRPDAFRHPYLTGIGGSLLALAFAEYRLAKDE